MFCSNCGQAIGEGKAFCRNCGAPAPTLVEAVGEPQAGRESEAPSLAAESSPSPAAPPLPPPPPAPATDYGAAGQSPQGPPGRRSRTGLIVGIAVAAVVVLAGAGTGAYLLLRGDDSAGKTTTLAESSSTTAGHTTSTGSETTTTGSGTVTSQTIPDLTTSTSGLSTTSSAAGDSVDAYLAATDDLVEVLLTDDARIPELADVINDTAPEVPRSVYDELQGMMGELDATSASQGLVRVPAQFEEADAWLQDAAMHMGSRIYATIQGIEAMWHTGSVDAATEFFDLGRKARDDYRASFEKFLDLSHVDWVGGGAKAVAPAQFFGGGQSAPGGPTAAEPTVPSRRA